MNENKEKDKIYLPSVLIFILLIALFIGSIIFIDYLVNNTNLITIIRYFNNILVIAIIIGFFIDLMYYRFQRNVNVKKDKIITIKYDYYREIISNYSPGILSYIHDMRFNFRKDFICTFLYLEKEGFLKLRDDNFIEVTNNNYSHLPYNLVTFIKYINYLNDLNNPQKSKNSFKKIWLNSIKEELKEKKLIKNSNLKIGILGYLLLLEIALFFLFIPLFNYDYSEPMMIVPLIVITGFLFILSGDRFNIYLTNEGNEIKSKLLGLKNFINSFSNLDESEIREIKIWEDYTLYTMILNTYNNLIKENNELFNRIYYKRIYQNNKK